MRRLLRLSSVLLLIIIALPPALGQSAGDVPERVIKVLRDYVMANPQHQLVGVGSWIKGGYRPGVSDHDIRIIMPSGTSDDAAQAAWRSARQGIIQGLTREFQGDGSRAVEDILKRTNLYAPQQLMRGAQDLDDATRIFRGLRQVPNLGFHHEVNSSTPLHYFEGLYGEGALPNIQYKELGEGRLIYRSGNRVYTGRLDLTHLAEGQGRYTVSGTANTAYQWASHASDALNAKDSRALLKYLDRLEGDLVKTRNLAKLAGDSPVRGELRDLMARIRANPGAMSSYGDEVASLLRKAQMEASLMKKLGATGTVGQSMIRALLEGREGASRLWKALGDVSGKIPVAQLVDGLFKAWMVHGASLAAGENDMMSLYTTAFGVALDLGATSLMQVLPPLLLAEIVRATLDLSRAGGHDMVASTQDAGDLLAGIYTGVGRAGVDDRAYTLEQLVANFWQEHQLQAFVYARCVAAAQRGFGRVGNRIDMDTAEAIFAKCYPVIYRAWLSRRELMAMEYHQLADQVAQDLLLLTYTPIPAELQGGKVTVKITPTTASGKQGDRITRFRAILRTLLGPQAKIFANVYNTWTPAGKDTGHSDGSVSYNFSEPGKQIIKLEQTVSLGAANVPAKSPFLKEITREVAVEITVAEPGGAKQAPFAAVSAIPFSGRVRLTDGALPRTYAQVRGQIQADVPMQPGVLAINAGEGELPHSMSPNEAEAARCLVSPGKTARVLVTTNIEGGEGPWVNQGNGKYRGRIVGIELMLHKSYEGFPIQIKGNLVTFTPRQKGKRETNDTATILLKINLVEESVDAEGRKASREYSQYTMLVLVGGKLQ